MSEDTRDENQMDIVCNCGHRRWEHSRTSDQSVGQGKCELCNCEQFHSLWETLIKIFPQTIWGRFSITDC